MTSSDYNMLSKISIFPESSLASIELENYVLLDEPPDCVVMFVLVERTYRKLNF